MEMREIDRALERAKQLMLQRKQAELEGDTNKVVRLTRELSQVFTGEAKTGHDDARGF